MPEVSRSSDWAENRAREIVEPYRSLFKDETAAHVDGLINVLAGELRAVERNMQHQAVAAGEAMMTALQALSAR